MAYTFQGYEEKNSKPSSDEKYSFQGYEEEPEESTLKSTFRSLAQVPLGIAKTFTYPLDIMTMIGTGEALAELDDLKERFPDIDESKYLEAVQQASEYGPHQGMLENVIEETTGIPLTAKTRGQKLLRLGSEAGGFRAGGIVPKASAAVTAPTVSAGLESLGAPEMVSDLAGFITSQFGIPEAAVRGISRKGAVPKPKSPSFPEQVEPFGRGATAFESEYEMGQKISDAASERLSMGEKPSILPQEIPSKGTDLSKRSIQQSDKKIGLEVPTQTPRTAPENEVGKIFSEKKFKNTTQGGKALKDEIMRLDEADYKNVNQLYENARAENRMIEDIHPELADTIQQRLEELEKIPAPSGPQKDLINSMKNILSDIVEYGEEGGRKTISGYKQINNQTLIDQVQSLRQKIDYDFAHGNTKNIFKPLINDLQEAAAQSAENINPQANVALKEAREAYKNWAETFDNDYIRPFRDKSNKDYSKLFTKSHDIDNFNVIRGVIEKTPQGETLSKATLRELVQGELAPYIKNPQKMNSPEFARIMNELEAVITPEQSRSIEQALKKEAHRFGSRTFSRKPLEKNLLQGKSPEQIARMTDTISGMKEVEKLLSGTEQGKQLVRDIKDFKAADILYKGKLNAPEKSQSIAELLNDREKVAFLKETLGTERVNQLREIVKDAQKLEASLAEMEKIKPEFKEFKDIFSPQEWYKAAKYSKKKLSQSLIMKTLNPKNLKMINSVSRNLTKKGMEALSASDKKKLAEKLAPMTRRIVSNLQEETE